eukprot:COSAG03_NODE_90_length_13417_cov_11.032512_6_plen_45_part_00
MILTVTSEAHACAPGETATSVNCRDVDTEARRVWRMRGCGWLPS